MSEFGHISVIDGIMTDFASLLCGVPHGSVLGPIKLCLFPLGLILRHTGYHSHADDSQLYISFRWILWNL